MEGIQSVGIREFQANLHKYTRQTDEPIAITFHGEAIGYFVPAKPGPQQQDVAALQESASTIGAPPTFRTNCRKRFIPGLPPRPCGTS